MKLLTLEDAKPCPFCGNENLAVEYEKADWWINDRRMIRARLYCPTGSDGCKATIERIGDLHETALDLAVIAWNRREG